MHNNTGKKPETRHRAGEDYLEAILVLSMKNGMVRSIDVANFLNHSKPSISRAVSVLREAGYITVDKDHLLYLTDEGRAIAEEIYERHRFFTDFLVKIGVNEEVAEADACQMEHAISAESFDHLKEFFKNYMQENK